MTEQDKNLEYIKIQYDPNADLSFEEMKAMLAQVAHNNDVLQAEYKQLADHCGFGKGFMQWLKG